MRKLLLAGLIAVLTAVPVVAAIAPASSANGYWACAGADAVDVGACLRNPLPEELPDVDAELPGPDTGIEVHVDVPGVEEPVVEVYLPGEGNGPANPELPTV